MTGLTRRAALLAGTVLLAADPFEQHNLLGDPRFAAQRAALETELRTQSNAALGL